MSDKERKHTEKFIDDYFEPEPTPFINALKNKHPKDIKPCPFCGGEAELNTMGAMCRNILCGALMPGNGTTAKFSTIECWNTRVKEE